MNAILSAATPAQPARLGRYDVTGVMVCHALFLLIMVYVGCWVRLGALYFCGLVVAACLAAYQYLLIRDRQRERCFKAFLNNNWVGAAIFACIVADFWFSFPVFEWPAAIAR